MNGATLVYNASLNAQHSFQVNGIREAYINNNGWTVIYSITWYNITSNNDITCITFTASIATIYRF